MVFSIPFKSDIFTKITRLENKPLLANNNKKFNFLKKSNKINLTNSIKM